MKSKSPICDDCLKELRTQILNPPKNATWFLIHISHDKCAPAAEAFLRFLGAVRDE